jgi:hypothetical protein
MPVAKNIIQQNYRHHFQPFHDEFLLSLQKTKISIFCLRYSDEKRT